MIKGEFQGKTKLVAAVWYNFQELVFIILDEPVLEWKYFVLHSFFNKNLSYKNMRLKIAEKLRTI